MDRNRSLQLFHHSRCLTGAFFPNMNSLYFCEQSSGWVVLNSPTTIVLGSPDRARGRWSVAGIQLLGQLSSPIVVVLTARALLFAGVCTSRRRQPVSAGTAVKTAACTLVSCCKNNNKQEMTVERCVPP